MSYDSSRLNKFALPGGERFALAKGLGDSACKERSLPCAMVELLLGSFVGDRLLGDVG